MTDPKTFTGPEGWTFTLGTDGTLCISSPLDREDEFVNLPLAELRAFADSIAFDDMQRVERPAGTRVLAVDPAKPDAERSSETSWAVFDQLAEDARAKMLGLLSSAISRTVGDYEPDAPLRSTALYDCVIRDERAHRRALAEIDAIADPVERARRLEFFGPREWRSPGFTAEQSSKLLAEARARMQPSPELFSAEPEAPEPWQCGVAFFHPNGRESTHCSAGAPDHDGPHVNPYEPAPSTGCAHHARDVGEPCDVCGKVKAP